MRTIRTGCLVCVLAGCISGAMTPRQSAAQDTHYWNNQYGPRSMLLGGAVIGSANDMSATYYNPGALGYIKEPEVLLSANAYQIEKLSIRPVSSAVYPKICLSPGLWNFSLTSFFSTLVQGAPALPLMYFTDSFCFFSEFLF